MRRLIDDGRHAVRALRRRPVLTLLAGACLAIGIGVNAGVYSVVHAALLRPLPFGNADRLLLLSARSDLQGTSLGSLSPDVFEFLQQQGEPFQALGAAANAEFDLADGGVPERWTGARATGGFFAVLGVEMLLGRDLDAEGDLQEAILSHRLWLGRYNGDPAVIGRDIRLDGQPFRIVGVAPPDVRYPAQADIWVPNDTRRYTGTNRTNGFLTVVGRLRDDVSYDAGVQRVEQLGQTFLELTPDWISDGIAVNALNAPQVQRARPVLIILMISVVVVLLMACLNAMSLYLIDADRESRTTALRRALGADARRIVSERVMQFVMLSVASGLVGTLVAVPVVAWLIPPDAIDLPGFAVTIDRRVLGFALLAACAAAVLVGLMPTVAAVREEPSRLLPRRGQAGGPAGHRRQMMVVVAQLALSIVLCVSAWSMTAHLGRLLAASPGYRVDDVLTARLGAPRLRYPTPAMRSRFMTEVRDRLAAVPGVVSVGAASSLPLGDNVVFWSFSIEDQPPSDPSDLHSALGRMTLPGYLETLGIPLLDGRALRDADDEAAEPVVLVSRAFQDAYWPGQSAIGRRIKRRTYDSAFPWLRIVGVVEDVREQDLGDDFIPVIYFAQAQHDTPAAETMTFVLRTSGAMPGLPDQVRRAVRELDAGAAVFRLLTMADRLDESTGQRRLGGTLLGAFGGIGLLVSLVGVYGVVSANVTRRRREFGVRLALGDSPGGIARAIVQHAVALAVAGTALGWMGLTFLVEPARQLLPGLDVPAGTILQSAGLLVLATLVAVLGPAWRASRTDAARALAEE